MAALYGQRTFAQIVAKIGYKLLGPTNTLSTTSNPVLADVKDTVNTYYKYLYSRCQMLWGRANGTFNTVDGTSLVTLPDAVQQIINMQIASRNSPLIHIPEDILFNNYPGAFVNFGKTLPRYWIDEVPASNNALQIQLWPIPDATYTVTYRYQARFAPLSADGDYSVILPEYEDYLYEGPLGELFEQLGDPRAQYHQARALDLENKAWLQNQKMMLLQPEIIRPWTDLLWPVWIK